MKSHRKIRLCILVIWVLLLSLGCLVTVVWAAGEPVPSSKAAEASFVSQVTQYMKANFTRATWDLVMRWVNFLILVIVIFKFARTPVISFLKGKQSETARAIERIEAEKELAEQKAKEGQIKLQASQERLELIQSRIVSEGQRQKEELIAAAEQESRVMLASARTRIDSQIQEAYQTIRAELIETAADKAMDRLPRLMTAEDHERMVGLWMDKAGS